MNPDQEATTSVNDPYDISRQQSRGKSQYAKEQQLPPPRRSAGEGDGEVQKKTTTYINIPMPSASSSSTEMNFPKGSYLREGRRHSSKELFTGHQLPPVPHHQDEFYSKNLVIASALVVTYLIEVTVQILLIVQCCRSFQQVDSVTDETSRSGTTSTASWSSSWFLVISSVSSSFLVTLISIMWVFRGMDFSGRLCGRLLCYVMHSFLLGLLWRYLKLAFAYDRADLEEFFKLKTIQTYIQSLPLVTIHLAWLLITRQLPQYPVDSYHALSSWLVVVEMLTAVTSLLLLSSTVSSSSSSSSPSTTTSNLQGGGFHVTPSGLNQRACKAALSASGLQITGNGAKHHFNDSGTASTHHDDSHHPQLGDNDVIGEGQGMMRIITTIKRMMSHYSGNSSESGRALLLISRLISLGMLVYEMNYWTGFITLAHLTVCLVWLTSWAVMRTGGGGGDDAHASSSSTATSSATTTVKSHHENCDSGSTSSNDSGLVTSEDVIVSNNVTQQNGKKSRVVLSVLTDNSVQMKSSPGEGEHDNASHLVYSVNNGYMPADEEKCDQNSLTLSNCMSAVIQQHHQRVNAATTNPGNSAGFLRLRQVLMRVLLLTYVLFWDLSSSRPATRLANRINLWATALPVLLVTVENVSITIFHWHNGGNIVLAVTSGTCLILGWLLVAAYQLKRQRHLLRRMTQQQKQLVHNGDYIPGTREASSSSSPSSSSQENDDVGSRGKSANKKEPGECLSLCCSSLSHPLNIKRKGHHLHDEHSNNFCNDKMSFDQHDMSAATPNNTVKYNEYEGQQELGKLMNCQMTNGHQHNSHDSRSSTGRPRRNKGVPKFPDLGITSDRTGVVGDCVQLKETEDKVDSAISSRLYQEEVACAKSASNSNSSPVTNNYTNIKKALTRRISNQSCASTSNNKSSHHHRSNQDRDSVKGEGGQVVGEVISSSLKLSSSPSTRLPQPPTNSNKCMPISIKSPISWLPETCCNDSNGSNGSSNSRNTNTLHPESRFYSPESYIDLDNNNEIGGGEKNGSTAKRKSDRNSSDQAACDFSIVFFEGRGTSRSYKQKQSRPGIVVGRTARSANATPVASSKQQTTTALPLDIRAVVRQQQNPFPHQSPSFQQQQQTQHNNYHQQQKLLLHDHRHQYSYDDDPIERASKGTRRNQIMGKTYLSDGGSLTSLDGLCEIRASTPVEIKKASRVIVNYPPPHHQLSDSKTVSRCLCKVDASPGNNNRKSPSLLIPATLVVDGEGELGVVAVPSGNNNIYEKLIDDSYGILICEGENTPRQSGGTSGGGGGAGGAALKKSCTKSGCVVGSSHDAEMGSSSCRPRAAAGVHIPSQKLRILCAKCLENHDPLLTNCVTLEEDHHHQRGNLNDKDELDHCHYNSNSIITKAYEHHHHHPQQQQEWKCAPNLVVSGSPCPQTPDSDSTDYPSDTELTTNNVAEDDGQSLSTHFSSATYNWHHPHHYQPTQLSQFIWAASTMMNPPSSQSGGGGATTAGGANKEFTSLEYVRTWLMASHPRTYPINAITNTHQHPPPQPHHPRVQENTITDSNPDGKGIIIPRTSWKTTVTPHRNHTATTTATHHHRHNNINHHSRNDKGLSSSARISLKNKSGDKTISKKRRFRQVQLEKRQRPIGRGASPPAKELVVCSPSNNNSDVPATAATTTATDVAATVPSTTTAASAAAAATSSSTRLQPPPSRKQHPLLLYDMIPRQPQQKPLTATSHKKCRDQLDLFHKELETVV